MKIRNGFVSNSSSSSFVVLGVKDYKGEENFSNGIESIYLEGSGNITGYILAHDEYIEASFYMKDLIEKAQKIAESLNVDINDIELFAETTYN